MRLVASSLPLARTPWLIGGGVLSAAGIGVIAVARQPLPGWILLGLGGGLLLLTARPAYRARERIVLDDAGVTDLATSMGPIPWSDIVEAQVLNLAKTSLVTIRVVNPAAWEARLPEPVRRLRLLAPDLNLPPVLLFTPRLTLSPEEIVGEINRRARGHRG